MTCMPNHFTISELRMKLLIMNSLDEQYGSTYRIRAFATELSKLGHAVDYYEKQIPFWIKLFDMLWCTSVKPYETLIIQKFNPLTIGPMLICKIRKKKLVVDWDDWDTGLQKNFLFKMPTWLCEKLGPFLADLITSHNSNLLYLVKNSTSTMILSQGYDEELFAVKNNSKRLQRNPKIRIGYLCTFTRGGTLDLDEILVAISKVTRADVEFVMIGGGKLLKHFIKRASDLHIQNISFLGHVTHARIPQVLSSLDVGIVFMKDIPANRRRMSFKVIEYLASGIRVIGKTVGRTHELFSPVIETIEISEIHNYLNKLKMDAPKEISELSTLLIPFKWNTIILKLHQHLILPTKEQ